MLEESLHTNDRHIEEALAFVEAVLDHEGLSQIQELVFREAWRDKSYSEIATSAGYDAEYIKAVGFKMWQLLSKVLTQKITKNNFKFVLRRRLQLQSNSSDRPSILEQKQPSVLTTVSPVKLPLQYQWKTAIDVSVFYGRTQELETLENWIVGDRCRLVAILGMVGIGKTTLSIKLLQQIQANFDFVIWRSVRNTPSITSFLDELIQYLANQQDLIPVTIDHKLSILMHLLQQHRCLIVLDNFESLLQSGNSLGTYQTGYEAYGQLLRQVGEESHQSCLLLTSREKPKGFAVKEDEHLSRSLHLKGLQPAEVCQLLDKKGVYAHFEDTWNRLIQQYEGNPLILKSVMRTIQNLFGGDIAEFLAHKTVIFGDAWDLLEQQFNRLSVLEQQVVYWLVIKHSVSLTELAMDVAPPITRRKLLEALESLERRSLIERSLVGFTLKPMIKSFIIERLTDQADKEDFNESLKTSLKTLPKTNMPLVQ